MPHVRGDRNPKSGEISLIRTDQKITRSKLQKCVIASQVELLRGIYKRSVSMLQALPILADYVYIGGGLLGTILVILLIVFLLKKI